jgi:5-methylcytosine-specific restriction protein A
MPSLKKVFRPWSANKPPRPSAEKWKEHDPFYDTPQWRATRKKQLQEHPLCKECIAENKTTAATVADHIQARKDGGADFDPANLQSLCRSHHNRKSQKERRTK